MPALFRTCPRCGHKPKGENTPLPDRCESCALVYDEWVDRQVRATRRKRGFVEEPDTSRGYLFRLLFEVREGNDPLEIGVRAIVYAALAVWGIAFIFMDYAREPLATPEIGASFMHHVNLVFHEAGHFIFALFGDFMRVLGGSLMQLLMPLIVVYAFIFRHRNTFGAACGVWWLAQSLMDIAPYVADARDQKLILLGGGTGHDRPGFHDWNNLLGRMELLDSAPALGATINFAGELLMWTAIGWGGYVLWRQWRHRRT